MAALEALNDAVQVLDTVSIVLPIIFFSEIGDGANCVCGGARPLLDMGSKGRSSRHA